MKALTILSLLALMVACSPTKEPFSTPSETVNAPMPAVTLPITWSLDENAVVLRLEEAGGMLATAWGTEIPMWTLYGNGLVVWTQDGAPTPGFTRQVWTGHLDEEEIAELLSFAQEMEFFDLDEVYKAPRFEVVDTDESESLDLEPNLEGVLDQPTGSITLKLLEKKHRVQVYPTGWTEAPKGYRQLRERIISTLPGDATPFIPSVLLLSANPVSMDDGYISAEWPFTDVMLAHAVTTPLKLDTEQGVDVVEFLTSEGVITTSIDKLYRLDLRATIPQGP